MFNYNFTANNTDSSNDQSDLEYIYSLLGIFAFTVFSLTMLLFCMKKQNSLNQEEEITERENLDSDEEVVTDLYILASDSLSLIGDPKDNSNDSSTNV